MLKTPEKTANTPDLAGPALNPSSRRSTGGPTARSTRNLPSSSGVVQRKPASGGGGASTQIRSASEWLNDPAMDAAHRGVVQMKSSGSPGVVQMKGNGQQADPRQTQIPTREDVQANPQAYGIPPGGNPNDWFNEYVAHTVAYMSPEQLNPNALDPNDPEYQSKLAAIQRHHDTMRAWGYDPNSLTFVNDSRPGDTQTGFQAVRLDPLNPDSGVGSIVGFRGTEPWAPHQSNLTNPLGALDDVATDLGRDVGSTQYEANQERIRALIAGGTGDVTLTGHSLGGALAQHAAAGNSDLISDVVGFQAPGIGSNAANAFNQANSDGHIGVRFHEHSNDVVHRAGEQKLAGTTNTYTDTNDPGVGGAHGTNFMYNGIGGDGNQVTNLGAGSTVNTTNYDPITNRLGWEGGRQLLGGVGNIVASPFQGAWALGQGLGNAAVNAGQGLWDSGSSLVGGIASGGSNIVGGISQGASQMWNGNILQGLGTMATGTGRGIADIAGGVWDGATGLLGTGANLVGDVGGAVVDGVSTLGSELVDGVGTLASGVGNLAKWGWNSLTSLF